MRIRHFKSRGDLLGELRKIGAESDFEMDHEGMTEFKPEESQT